MPVDPALPDALFYRCPQFAVAGHDKMCLFGFSENARCYFDKVLRRLLRLETGDHAHNDFIFRDVPCTKHLPPRPGLKKFLDSDGVPGQYPVASANHATLLS